VGTEIWDVVRTRDSSLYGERDKDKIFGLKWKIDRQKKDSPKQERGNGSVSCFIKK